MRPSTSFLLTLLLSALPSNALPQDGLDIASGWDRARNRPLGGLSGSRASAHPSMPNDFKHSPAHIKNPRHRPTCDLSLSDSETCNNGEACVVDPFADHHDSERQQKSVTNIGICTASEAGNMCGGILGAKRACGMDGWRCGKPGRCERENVSDCDWLCVRPPPSSMMGMGFGF